LAAALRASPHRWPMRISRQQAALTLSLPDLCASQAGEQSLELLCKNTQSHTCQVSQQSMMLCFQKQKQSHTCQVSESTLRYQGSASSMLPNSTFSPHLAAMSVAWMFTACGMIQIAQQGTCGCYTLQGNVMQLALQSAGAAANPAQLAAPQTPTEHTAPCICAAVSQAQHRAG
jgi:hypothetical protein